jgi:hypothetical protein
MDRQYARSWRAIACARTTSPWCEDSPNGTHHDGSCWRARAEPVCVAGAHRGDRTRSNLAWPPSGCCIWHRAGVDLDWCRATHGPPGASPSNLCADQPQLARRSSHGDASHGLSGWPGRRWRNAELAGARRAVNALGGRARNRPEIGGKSAGNRPLCGSVKVFRLVLRPRVAKVPVSQVGSPVPSGGTS